MKKDIESREDIKIVVDSFYEKIKTNKVIGYIYSDVVNINWEKHLPVMYDFWENALFYTGSYTGNPINLHKHIDFIIPLTPGHFELWKKLFEDSVDEFFEGEKATLAKQKAISISTIMQIKIFDESLSANKIF